MIYRNLGNTDIKASAITLGTWAIGGWLWGGTHKKNAIAGIRKSIDMGVTSIDTAPVYGFGVSESIVGEAIQGYRDKIQVFTKYGLRWNVSDGKFYFNSQDNEGNPMEIHKYAGKQSVINECEESLRRLKIDYIDLYQIHWPDPTTPIAETMEAVEKLKKDGKIKAAGVSNYDASQMKEADETTYIAANQVPFSMIERDIEKELIPYCIDNSKSILAYSPLQRGLLTGKVTKDYKFNDGDHRTTHPSFQEPNLSYTHNFLEKIKPIAEKHNISLAQLVISWTIHHPGITTALVGARNEQQATENAQAADVKLADEETNMINHELDKLNQVLK